MVSYFERYDYSNALKNLAKAFLEAAGVIRSRVEEKLVLAARGFTALLATVVFALFSVGSYLYVQFAEVDPMPDNNDKAQSQQQSPPEPSPEQPSNQSSQSNAESDAQALFQTVKRSFEGGSETRTEEPQD